MKRFTVLLLGLAALAAWPRAARAHQVEYISPHPVPHKYGGGFCHINVPHTHNYRPGHPRMYRSARGQQYFIGDPSPFGYDGPRHTYYGAHPVFEAEVRFGHPVFCYMKGPHVHWYQPQQQAPYQLAGGAYWYVGEFPTVYYQERPRYAVINEAYAPMPYTRPVVDVAVAPAVVRADISLGGPGWRAHAMVGGPPAPAVVPPPPPGPTVQVGVDINLGGAAPVVVVPGGPPGHSRHDHGKHKGWRDHGRPSRFILGPAPVRGPLLQRRAKPAPMPRLAPARRSSPTPSYGSAAAAAARSGSASRSASGSGSPAATGYGRAAAQGRKDNRKSRR